MTGTIETKILNQRKLTNMKVGVVGIGAMGSGIVISLLRNHVTCFFCSGPSRLNSEYLRTAGACELETPEELTASCDVIILSLPKTEDVVETCGRILGANDTSSLTTTLLIDTTTADPGRTDELSAKLASAGISYAAAPLTKGPADVRRGAANAILGSSESTRALCRLVLSTFCEYVLDVSDAQTAQRIKLINNALSMGIVALTSEAIQAAHLHNIDIELLKKLFDRGGVKNKLSQALIESVQENSSSKLEFRIEHAYKDLRSFLDICNNHRDFMVTVSVANRFQDKIRQSLGHYNIYRIVNSTSER